MSATITFLGAAGTVTGSKFLIQADNHKVLIDCGLFQGLKELRLQNWAPFSVDPSTIHSVILTHAHLDHCGYLPLLVKTGFKGKIYCTPPTRDIAKIILMDAAKILEEDSEYANKMGFSKHQPARPLYTEKDVIHAMKQFAVVDRKVWVSLGNNHKFRFTPSGHILGSAFVEYDLKGKRIVFTGDLGRKKPLILNAPELVERADILVCESTYGDRIHDNFSPLKALQEIVNETLKRNGHLLIPSFAVGRTQDILYLLSILKRERKIPDVPIYLDSPMGINATEVFTSYPDWHKLTRSDVQSMVDVVTMIRSQQQSNEILRKRKSSIVIAGSGMITGGRILHHLYERLSNENNTVLLVGFQAAGTRGRLLLDGINELKFFGQYIPVKAQIKEIDTLSAHADQSDTIKWIQSIQKKPKDIYLVHGEPQSCDALRVRLKDEFNVNCIIAKQFEEYEL